MSADTADRILEVVRAAIGASDDDAPATHAIGPEGWRGGSAAYLYGASDAEALERLEVTNARRAAHAARAHLTGAAAAPHALYRLEPAGGGLTARGVPVRLGARLIRAWRLEPAHAVACAWCGADPYAPCTERAAHPTTGRGFSRPLEYVHLERADAAEVTR